MSGVLSEARYVLVTRLLVPASSFILLIWIGRHSDVLLGQYALATTFYFVLQTLPLLGLTPWILREVAREPHSAGSLFGTVGLVAMSACALINGVLYAWLPNSVDASAMQQAVYVVGLTIAPGILAFLSELVLIGLRQARWVAYTALAENGLRLVASIWLLRQGAGVVDLIWVLLATRVFALGSYAVAGLLQGNALRPRFEWGVLHRMRGVLPIFLTGTILSLVLSRLDYFVLAYFQDEALIGYYAVAYRLLEIVQMALTAVLMALFPRLSRLYATEPQRFRSTARMGLLITVVVCTLMAFVGVVWADRYVAWLFSNQYPRPVLLAQGFVALVCLIGVDMYMAGLLNAADRQLDDFRAQVAGALVYTCVIFLLVPQWGGMGALVAMGVACAIQLAVRLVRYRRRVGRLRCWGPLISLGSMALAMLALAFWGPITGDLVSLLGVTLVGMLFYGLGLAFMAARTFGTTVLHNWPARAMVDVRPPNTLPGVLDHVRADLRAWCCWHVRSLRQAGQRRAHEGALSNWGLQAVLMHRFARWAWLNQRTRLARLINQCNLILTKAELPPWAHIGPGLVLTHTCGTIVVGHVGPNSVMGAWSAVGRRGEADIGAGPGIPLLEHAVHLKHRAAFQGPIRANFPITLAPHVWISYQHRLKHYIAKQKQVSP
ncbi:RfbX Membrane protein involved in the export of O-antigen and teichoic acid [Comamonadaceae bacterium]